MTRLDRPDPVAAWRAHKEDIRVRKQKLDAFGVTRLYLKAPGTDLVIDTVENGCWVGGYDLNELTQTEYIPNIPTEEIFTVPHKYKVNGTVASTLPLNYNGSMIEGIRLTVRDGLVVEEDADRGPDVLRGILGTDKGSRYFGEIALVPITSPIYQTKTVYLDTLLDEIAVCHMALGKAPASIIPGGSRLSDKEKDAMGINVSSLHVDFMIGSD